MDHLDLYGARAMIRAYGAGAYQRALDTADAHDHRGKRGDAHQWRRIADAIQELTDQRTSTAA